MIAAVPVSWQLGNTPSDVLDALKFGSNPEVLQAVGAVQEDGDPFDEPQALSGSVLPGSDYRESLFVRRAWAELSTLVQIRRANLQIAAEYTHDAAVAR